LGAANTLYTFQAGDSSYETISIGTQLKGGQGYWAYVSSTSSLSLPTVSAGRLTVQLPAGQWVMIGNAFDTTATVSGADSVMVYDSVATSYVQTTILQPGAGAWAFSSIGGQATIAASS
ncbi:MAG TPA: hypothetical protein VIU62_05400, partial [Chloroflexota bacterium]